MAIVPQELEREDSLLSDPWVTFCCDLGIIYLAILYSDFLCKIKKMPLLWAGCKSLTKS